MSQLQHQSWRLKTFFFVALLGILMMIGSSFDGISLSKSVSAAPTTILPSSIVTFQGSIGSSNTVENLHVRDQSGTDTDWSRFVQMKSRSTPYVGYRSYVLPPGVDASAVINMQLKANYRGPSTSTQVWTWFIYDWTTDGWDTLGNNSGANWSSWKLFTFDTSGNAAKYINSSTQEIRIYVESNNTADNMQLDYEAIEFEVSELSYTTLAPADIVTYQGATGGNQPTENLHVWDQNGDETDWNRYVQFKTTSEVYVGYRAYYLPSDVDVSSFNKLFVQANYRGPSTDQQVWTWFVRNWRTDRWDTLGNNSGADWSSWKEFFFTAEGSPADYINPSTREIRVYSEANNTSAYMQLDFEAVILESNGSSSSSSGGGDTTTVSYSPTTDLFPNPERGFTRAAFKSLSSDPQFWDVRMLNYANDVEFLSGQEEAINTQVSCYFLLDKYFVHSTANNGVYIPIEGSFLQNIEQNLDKVRQAGKKCVLTFAYSDPIMYPRTVDDGASEQSTDEQRMIDAVTSGSMRAEPDLPHIMAHLDQLKPILERNSDVIAVMKTGLIGIWGEWHYTTHFLDNPFLHDDVSAYQQGRRNQVVNKLLEVLPADRTIMLRRPFHKQPVIGGRTEPVRDTEAFKNTPVARIGYHNDAFINVNGDMGTYGSQADRNYMSQETLYLPMGGETNWIPNNANVDRGCSNTISEMSTFHWSFIAGGYYAPTIKGWRDNNCIHNLNNIQGSIIDRLGYRFRLTKGVYPNSATAGSQMSIKIDLVNEGFAAPYNGRNVFLVLKNQATGDREYIYMPVDPRFWLAGQQHVIDQTVTLPSNLAPGQYQLALVLPDSHPNLSGDSRYAVRFANANLWPRPNLNNWSAGEWPNSESQSKGLWSKDLWDGTNNLLHTVTVTN